MWFPGNTCRACVYARLIPPTNATVEYHLAFMVNPVWGVMVIWKQLKF